MNIYLPRRRRQARRRYQPWKVSSRGCAGRFTFADLAPLAAAAGVTGTVVIQTVTEPSPAEQEAIFDRTARRVYQLPVPEP